ncbi:DUF4245 domain-containing protein [Rhodococcus spelaei]|uniref:DUF4245 domain-containing protein n=1 Tax=Rhodococcus spelaei TaxID=2546320 RepID=A0A541BNJ3_9NOCA|nr:DUF4245 domain-containing protein [Rhodococcus spelaei]TQF73897.1 DUF4245 domain-containing protein [Rhodococcus spelaei]
MAGDKPRILQSNRDMLWSMIPLVLLCLIIAGIASQCTLSPGGPTPGPVPHFDINAALKYDARDLGFPIRNPAVPEGWQPNSGSRGTATGDGGGDVSTVGFITDRGAYLQLSQSAATEETLVPWVAGGPRSSTGVEQIGPDSWVKYTEEGSEPIWVTNLGDVRVLIKGAGSEQEYTTLATAVGAAQPLAH